MACREDFEADGISEQWREHPWDKAQINPAVWQNTSYWLNQVWAVRHCVLAVQVTAMHGLLP